MTLSHGQTPSMTRGGVGSLAKHSASTDMREQLTAFDDAELRSWLMECIVDGSERFLCAVAEAAVAANTEDYLVIRPALVTLWRKHNAKRAFEASSEHDTSVE